MNKEIQILVVDDMASVRFLLKKELQDMGYTKSPFEASNVRDALKILEDGAKGITSPVDYILSDYNMVGLTGLDFYRLLQDDARFKSIPFLMITSENEEEVINEALSIGCNHVLTKPWRITELERKIEVCWDSFKDAE